MATGMSGVFSTIDTDTLVSAAITKASGPLNMLKSSQSLWELKQTALEAIKSSFSTLQTAANELRSASNIRAVAASSSNDSIDVSATSTAVAGIHQLVVNQLANSERQVHAGVADSTAALGAAGQFVYTYGTETRTLQTTDTTTLEDLRDLINEDGANPGVSASILEYDSGNGLKYHLVLSGQDTGAEHAITLEAATTVAGFGPGEANWTRTQAAQNAQVRIDSYPASGWIERSTNSIDDVVSGVTFDIQATGTATISLTRSNESIKKALNTYVSVMNSFIETLDQYTGYDADSKKGGVFQGDLTITNLIQDIRSAITEPAAGFKTGSNAFTVATQIGLSVDKDGKVSLDQDVLTAALSSNYEAVVSLLTASGSGVTDSADVQFGSVLSSTVAGTYQLKITYDVDGNVASAWFAQAGSTDWRSATVSGNEITGASGGPEAGLNVTATAGHAGQTLTYEVRAMKGFAAASYEKITAKLDMTTGVFAVKADQMDTAMADLDKQIERMQARLDAKEETLKAQYARMEETLARLDSMKTAYEALLTTTKNDDDN
ncbi:MAG: flagellar filament capping protein FliD [Phycisphaerae bacterium]|jgi:flagellar hook-associated protein 2